MRFSLILYILSIFFPIALWAENNVFLKTISGIANGRLCAPMTRYDLKPLEKFCKIPDELFSFSETLYENAIFSLAATHQLKKNSCIKERLALLMNSKKLNRNWNILLTKAWLGKRKSELIVKTCNEISFKKTPVLGVLPNQHFNSFSNQLEPKDSNTEKWLEICNNKEQMVALRAADKIFEFSIPGISTPEFFNLIEKNRSMIVDKRTRLPLTDDDILKMNLDDSDESKTSEMENLTFNPNKYIKFQYALQKSFKSLIDEREKFSQNLKKSKNKTSEFYNLDYAQKDYLFDDDSVIEILRETGELADTPVTSETISISNGAKCILNHYETTLTGEIAELVILARFFSGIISKAFKINRASKSITSTQSMLIGAIPASVFQMGREIAKSCVDSSYMDKKLTDQRRKQGKVDDIIDTLPTEVGFANGYLEAEDFPIEKTPSCKELPKSLMLNDLKHASCIQSTLLALSNLAPLKTSLALTATGLSQ